MTGCESSRWPSDSGPHPIYFVSIFYQSSQWKLFSYYFLECHYKKNLKKKDS